MVTASLEAQAQLPQEESEKALGKVTPETLSVGNAAPKSLKKPGGDTTPDSPKMPVQSPENKKADSQMDLSPSMEMMVSLVQAKV